MVVTEAICEGHFNIYLNSNCTIATHKQ